MSPRADVEARLQAFADHADALALVHHDRRLSHGDLRDAVFRTAHALDDRGIRPGTIVVLLAGNEPEGIVARYAVNLLGAGITQPYAGLSAEARGRIVDDVDAAAVLVVPGHEDDADAVLEHSAPVRRILLDDALTADADATPVECRAHAEDVEQIRHTGGTTGHPKGITYTFGHHLRMLEHAWRPSTADEPDEEPEEVRQLVCTTVAHAAGGIADRTLSVGGAVVLLDGFDPGEVLATIERERITDLWLLPPLLHRLLDHPDLNTTDLSSLRTVIYGGAPAVPARTAEAVRRIGRVFVQFYGQTEAGGISVLTREEHDDESLLGTVGRVLPTTELSVHGPDGAALPDGEPGELWVRTGMEFDGYWKQPELTAQTLDADGWMHTGDVGYVDDRGYLHVVDRLGDVVVVVGGHVHTPEVEHVLASHDDVREAAVFGAPDDDGSESVHAAVVVEPGTHPDPEALTGLVVEKQGPMYAPEDVEFVDEMPLTDAGKVDKKALRRHLAPQ
ncbi:AMP-binding protein [Actinomycetospora corticicola]|uniref:Fatty-acyl-CoA synthase n=1 Tax=Actinomycetospora corticicola TaxID=663602 RepID=A0A7Y9E1A2_9PSEU|nr:AMP-binding protein [Actinomycetospora corticicola]NYD39284.1 fatty-acyl-CoA synthase [Actinomycetospora corticicola]